MWEKSTFESDFIAAKFFREHVFICNSPAAIRFAFNTKNDSFERKALEMRLMLKPLIGDGLFISDGELLRSRRALIAPTVHISRLPTFAPLMVEAALDVCERWENAAQEGPIDLLGEMGFLSAEVISRALFGRDLGRDYAEVIVGGFARYQRATSPFDLLALLGLPEWLPRPPNWRARKIVKEINQVLDEIIDRLEREPGESLMGEVMARAKGTLSRQELRNEAAVLFMAGHETTANTMAWALFLISQDADAEARLHAEIDSVLGGRAPTLGDVRRLTFTRAVIDETLRLYPPVPQLARQSTAAEEFEGEMMPRGSRVLVVPWLLHRKSQLWAEPDAFDPDRFLNTEETARSKYAYVPFSVGPRVCPGKEFALAETVLCLATLAQRFELRLQPGHEVKPVCRMTLRPGDRLPMIVRKRRSPAAAPAPIGATGCPLGHG